MARWLHKAQRRPCGARSCHISHAFGTHGHDVLALEEFDRILGVSHAPC